MGKAAQSAINDTEAIIAGLEKLKAQGVDTGQALTASLGKGISTADSVKALEAVRAQIESLRKVLGEKITDDLHRNSHWHDIQSNRHSQGGEGWRPSDPGNTSYYRHIKRHDVHADGHAKRVPPNGDTHCALPHLG